MAWLQLMLSTDAQSAEYISDAVSAQGALAVTLHDGGHVPLYEEDPEITPLWDETMVVGLFDESSEMTQVLANLNHALADVPYSQLRVEHLEDADWERAWMDRFQPMHFGNHLWICPSWHEIPDPAAVTLKLDPGMAFGTGTHATTALMLEWLASAAVGGQLVMDYGTGSGILAIAAAKLGADHVLAVDNDPRALTVANDNRQKNHIHPAQLEIYLHGQVPIFCADILLANILADPLKQLAADFANYVRPDGIILLSGILRHQADDVCAAYAPWFDMRLAATREDWVRLEGRRKA